MSPVRIPVRVVIGLFFADAGVRRNAMNRLGAAYRPDEFTRDPNSARQARITVNDETIQLVLGQVDEYNLVAVFGRRDLSEALADGLNRRFAVER